MPSKLSSLMESIPMTFISVLFSCSSPICWDQLLHHAELRIACLQDSTISGLNLLYIQSSYSAASVKHSHHSDPISCQDEGA